MPDARSSVVRDDDPEGKLYTIDVGIQAPGQALPKGTVKSLRVVEGVPATADRPVVRRLLGEVADRRRRLLPGADPGEHAGAARAPRRVRDRAAHLGLALGAQPRGAGLRRLPRGPGAHAAEPADEGPLGAGAGPQPAAREAAHPHRRPRRREPPSAGRRSARSSGRSTPEDSHEAPPRLRRRHPAARRLGRARAGPGRRLPRASCPSSPRSPRQSGITLDPQLRRPRPEQHRRGHRLRRLRLRLRRRREARHLLPAGPLGEDGQRQPRPRPHRPAEERALPREGRLPVRGRHGQGRGRRAATSPSAARRPTTTRTATPT